jgi:phosphopantothenoylcysteine decarboxylase/phosphopantothenate--cysteine ligase
MTRAAREFVSPLTFATLANRPVHTDMFAENGVAHIELAQKAELVIVVPATADIIARLAAGLADELLCAVALATRAPVLLLPSMNANMYLHSATQANLARLKELGYHLLEPESGFLACGAYGPGRLPSAEKILEAAAALLTAGCSLKGVKVLVTAGGTREHLDPVRFIGNASSGKMGYAVAAEAQRRGAEVVLISGPVSLAPPEGVEVVRVLSAEEMYWAVIERASEAKVVVKAAAVADFKPKRYDPQKIKKSEKSLVVELEPTPDILAELGRRKPAGQILVGFAAETHGGVQHAREKLMAKNLDLVVLNDVTIPGAGFEVDTNLVTFLYRDGRTEELPLLSKVEVARRLWDAIEELL